MIALAVLMVVLAGSCTKNFEERLDKTDADVATLQAAIGKYGELQSDITTVLQALRAEVGARPASEQQSVWNCINALQNQSNALDVAIRNLQKLVGETSVDAQISEAVENLVSEYDLDNLEATLQELKEKVNAKYDVTELEKKVGQLKDKLDKVLTSILKISAIEEMIQSVSIAPAYSDGSVKADEDNILTFKCIVSPAEALAGESNLEKCFTIARLEVEHLTKKASNKFITVTGVKALDKNQGAYKVTADISYGLPDENESLMIALNVKTGLSDYTTDFVKVRVPGAPDGFVDLGVKNADGKPLYWAECNLGATSPEEYGDYFAWGATELAYTGLPSNKFTFKNSRPDSYGGSGWSSNEGFAKVNAPYYSDNDSAYTEYTGSDGILLSSDDAATAVNSSWRTPTSEDFKALAANCVLEWTSDYNGTGVVGYIVYKAKNDEGKGKAYINDGWNKWDETKSEYVTEDASEVTGVYNTTDDTHIFLPAAGYGINGSLCNVESNGYYWSSTRTLNSDHTACLLSLSRSAVNPQRNGYRYYGIPIRPVTDAE